MAALALNRHPPAIECGDSVTRSGVAMVTTSPAGGAPILAPAAPKATAWRTAGFFWADELRVFTEHLEQP